MSIQEKQSCPQCGALNEVASAECSNCGAVLNEVEVQQVANAVEPVGKRDRSSLQTYIIAGLAVAVVALLTYIISTPEAKMGPPQDAPPVATEGGLPSGHPPVDQGAQSEALKKIVADLEAQVAASPGNDSLRLALANAMYDAGRHSDAKQHYSAYIKKNPDNLDARTDFATTVAAAGNVDSAIVVLNSILKVNGQHQRAAFNMAIMYRQKENRDSIMHWLRRVAEIDSTTPPGKGALEIIRDFESGGEHDHGGPGDTLH